jgi:hypothetical protein
MRATNRIAPHRKLHLLSVERGPGVCSIGNAGSHSRPPDERRLNHAIESLGTAWEGGRRQEVGSRRRAPRSSLPTPAASFDPSCGLPSARRTACTSDNPTQRKILRIQVCQCGHPPVCCGISLFLLDHPSCCLPHLQLLTTRLALSGSSNPA